MRVTRHAQIRSKQRGIPKGAVNLVITYGIGQKVCGDATKYLLDKRAIDHGIHELKSQIQTMEKLKTLRVIVADDEQDVITVYHEKHT